MYSINVIAEANHQRRKLYSRSLPHHQSGHFHNWLASLGVESTNILADWTPPEYQYFYKVTGPQTISQKSGSRFNLALIPSLLDVKRGQILITRDTGYIRLTVRAHIIKPVVSLDGEKWYSIIASVTSRPDQELEWHQPYIERFQYIPDVGDRLRLIYCPKNRFGAIQSHSEDGTNKIHKYFTAPYYHFDNCIQCQDNSYQIGFISASGPHFAELDALCQDFKGKQILDYYIDKVVRTKTDSRLTIITKQSFLLRVELVRVETNEEVPEYRMVVGKVHSCSRPNLRPHEPQFTAQDPSESDTSLFSPGTYIYIDHFVAPQIQPALDSTKSIPHGNNSEFAQICYFIGPKTPEFGACPIRPFY